MEKPSRVERIISGLQRLGYVEKRSPKEKFRAFQKAGQDDFYFVGEQGAFRKGMSPDPRKAKNMRDTEFERAVYTVGRRVAA